METIAKTIYNQLGGNRFAFMVGAKYFAFGDNSLQFRVMRNANRINCVKISLNGLDLYDLEFYWCDKNGCTVKASFTNVYGSDLPKFFTNATGLYTSL